MRQIALRLIGACALVGMAMPAAAEEPKGSEVFEHYCSHCHGPGDAPGTVQLSRTRGNDKGLLTQRTDLAPEYIEYIVRHGLKSMPAFSRKRRARYAWTPTGSIQLKSKKTPTSTK